MDRTSIGGIPPLPEPEPETPAIAIPESYDRSPMEWALSQAEDGRIDRYLAWQRSLPVYVCTTHVGLTKEGTCGHTSVGHVPDPCPRCKTRRPGRLERHLAGGGGDTADPVAVLPELVRPG